MPRSPSLIFRRERARRGVARHLACSPTIAWCACRPARSQHSWEGSQDRACRHRGDPDREANACVGDRVDADARADDANRFEKASRKKAGNKVSEGEPRRPLERGNLRGRLRRSPTGRQGGNWLSESESFWKSAAGRTDLPHRHAIACLSRAARHVRRSTATS